MYRGQTLACVFGQQQPEGLYSKHLDGTALRFRPQTLNQRSQSVALGSAAARFRFDGYIKSALVVRQVSFVDSQKEDAITLRHKFVPAAHENKVIVIVADHTDQTAGGFGSHQPIVIDGSGQTVWCREAAFAQVDAARGSDADSLSTSHDQAGV